ncbi:MAG: urease accessory protein UreD [Litoreibacter sp.]|nr:urease accessory protein UreD [Litoreibacter sp.]
MSAKRRGATSVIDGLHQSGSLKMMFPRGAGPSLMSVVVNCAGGMTGGDRFEIEGAAGEGASLTLTTQAAERLYRATGDAPARLRTTLEVARGGTLHWLPQETILFDGCAMERRLDVSLACDAQALIVEPLVFGRAAMGEMLEQASFRDHVRIARDGVLIHAEATRLEGCVASQLEGSALTGGGLATAAIVYAAPDAELFLDRARDLIGPMSGASLKAPDLLVIRLIAPDAWLLRREAIPLIAALSGADIPKTWTL